MFFIYIYIYIYIYILENATALGSRIPPHAVLLQVNDNTPVKLKIIFAIYNWRAERATHLSYS